MRLPSKSRVTLSGDTKLTKDVTDAFDIIPVATQNIGSRGRNIQFVQDI